MPHAVPLVGPPPPTSSATVHRARRMVSTVRAFARRGVRATLVLALAALFAASLGASVLGARVPIVRAATADGATATLTDVGGTIAANTTWSAAGGPYVLTDDILVAAGATLTVEAGTAIHIGRRMLIEVEGAIRAEGTAEAPIRIARVEGGDEWESIRIAGGPSVLRHVEITGGGARRRAMLILEHSDVLVANSLIANSEGAGIDIADGMSPTVRDSELRQAAVSNADPPAALRIRGSGSAVIEGNYFEANLLYAMFVHPNAAPRIAANRYFGNGFNGALVQGTVDGDGALPALGGRANAYYVRGTQLKIAPGGRLTVLPGATVRMGPGNSLWAEGTLRLLGEPGREVHVTADSDTGGPGQWRELRVRASSPAYDAATGEGTRIEHAVLEMGGSDTDGILVLEASARVAHTIVRRSANRGITVSGAEAKPTLLDVHVSDVRDPERGDALYVRSGAAPTVRFSSFTNSHNGVRVERDASADLAGHNRFEDNAGFAVRNDDRESCIEAGSNAWGAASGPSDASDRGDGCGQAGWPGEGQVVSDGVRYQPFEGQLPRPFLTAPRCGATRQTRPTVDGFAAPGSTVVLYVDTEEVGRVTAGPAEGGSWGPFTWTPDAPLATGSHIIHARSETADGAGASSPSDGLGLVIDPARRIAADGITLRQDLEGVPYVQPYASESGCTVLGDGTWQAHFHPGAPLTLELPVACPSGTPTVAVRYAGERYEAADAGGGAYRATFELGEGGTLRAEVGCGGDVETIALGAVNVALDGFIWDASGTTDDRVRGATVTLYAYDPAIDNYRVWDAASYYGQQNPQTTRFTGWYGFYPPPGTYRVVVEAVDFDLHIGVPTKITVEPILQTVALRSRPTIFLPLAHNQ